MLIYDNKYIQLISKEDNGNNMTVCFWGWLKAEVWFIRIKYNNF